VNQSVLYGADHTHPREHLMMVCIGILIHHSERLFFENLNQRADRKRSDARRLWVDLSVELQRLRDFKHFLQWHGHSVFVNVHQLATACSKRDHNQLATISAALLV
jgi:hypothetical protein